MLCFSLPRDVVDCDNSLEAFGSSLFLRSHLLLLDRLEYIHSRGIVYRDVKPNNFVLGGKLHCFGFTKYVSTRSVRSVHKAKTAK